MVRLTFGGIPRFDGSSGETLILKDAREGLVMRWLIGSTIMHMLDCPSLAQPNLLVGGGGLYFL